MIARLFAACKGSLRVTTYITQIFLQSQASQVLDLSMALEQWLFEVQSPE